MLNSWHVLAGFRKVSVLSNFVTYAIQKFFLFRAPGSSMKLYYHSGIYGLSSTYKLSNVIGLIFT